MIRRLCASLAISVVLLECEWFTPTRDGSAIDLGEAKKLGDAFMGDIIADRVAQGLTQMESGFVDSMPAGQAEQAIRRLFDYCGRPLDMEYKASQVGFKFYPNGTKKPMRKLFYAAPPRANAREYASSAWKLCRKAKNKVTTFGPLKLQSGSLPEWLK